MTPEEIAEDLPRPIVPEVPSAISPYIRRIVADNPSPRTGLGTNTYLAGIDEVAIIDPGPATDEHLDSIAGCGGDRIRWILLTHGHRSHSAGVAGLKERTGAEVLAFGDIEGVPVDRHVEDGETIDSTEFRIKVMHAPGHTKDHCFFVLEEERTIFTGDLILNGTDVLIDDPVTARASIERIAKIKRLKVLAPGHGYAIDDPYVALKAQLDLL